MNTFITDFLERRRLTRALADLVTPDPRKSRRQPKPEAILAQAQNLLAAGADPNGRRHVAWPLSTCTPWNGPLKRRSTFSRTLHDARLCQLFVSHGARLDNDTLEEAVGLVNEVNAYCDEKRAMAGDLVQVLLAMARAPVSNAQLDKLYRDRTLTGYENPERTAREILEDMVPGFADAFGVAQQTHGFEQATAQVQDTPKARPGRL